MPSLLDDARATEKLDPEGMIQKVLDLPFHCQDARYRVLDAPPRLRVKGLTGIILAGLGGSAIGGEILKGLIWKKTSLSFSVNHHYVLPAWVGKKTLVVCSSYSGNTEETLSVFHQAFSKKLPLLVIASGGRLLEEARRKKVPFVQIPGGLPPRSAFGYSFVTLLTALECAGLLPSYEEDFQEAMGLLWNWPAATA